MLLKPRPCNIQGVCQDKTPCGRTDYALFFDASIHQPKTCLSIPQHFMHWKQYSIALLYITVENINYVMNNRNNIYNCSKTKAFLSLDLMILLHI